MLPAINSRYVPITTKKAAIKKNVAAFRTFSTVSAK